MSGLYLSVKVLRKLGDKEIPSFAKAASKGMGRDSAVSRHLLYGSWRIVQKISGCFRLDEGLEGWGWLCVSFESILKFEGLKGWFRLSGLHCACPCELTRNASPFLQQVMGGAPRSVVVFRFKFASRSNSIEAVCETHVGRGVVLVRSRGALFYEIGIH